MNRNLLAALFLLVVASLLAGAHPAAASPPPAVPFTYAVQDQFGGTDAQGVPTEPNSWSYVHQQTLPVELNACDPPNYSPRFSNYQFVVDGAVVADGTACKLTLSMTPEAHHSVVVNARLLDGSIVPSRHDVFVHNYLVAGIGDSIGSGEGNPERWQPIGCLVGVCVAKAGPTWVDSPFGRACHRSTKAGQAQAALSLERISPTTAVTFVHLACSGATTQKTVYTTCGSTTGDGDGGLLDSYHGIEPTCPEIPAQISQLDALTCNVEVAPDTPCTSHRPIDALLISIGGNDLHFSNIVSDCEWNSCDKDGSLAALAVDLKALPQRLDLLKSTIDRRLLVRKAYFTEYPDPTHDAGGAGWNVNHLPGLLSGISGGEAMFLSTQLITPLNNALAAAAAPPRFNFVSGIATAFATHGYASDQCPFTLIERDARLVDPCGGLSRTYNRWVRTFEDSRWIQGPFDSPGVPSGTVHPNEDGHRAIANALLGAIVDPARPAFVHVSTAVRDTATGSPYVKPGDPFELGETVADSGNANASDPVGTVTWSDSLLSWGQTRSSYPFLAPGAQGTNATLFTGTLSPSAPCGTDIPATIEVASAPDANFQRPRGFSYLAVRAGAPGAASRLASVDVPRTIPRAFVHVNHLTGETFEVPGEARSSVSIATAGRVWDVRVTIDGLKVPSLDDLQLALIAPTGERATLANGGLTGTNLAGTTLTDDPAATSIWLGTAPYTGTFRSAESLAIFHGMQAQGTWTLELENGGLSSGTLTGWSLTVTPASC